MISGKNLFVLCTARIHNDEVRESVRYFVNEAAVRGYAVLVCNSTLEDQTIGDADAGCYSVFDLIPFSIADAVVLMPETIANHAISRMICAAAAEHQTPVLAYDGKFAECPSVFSYSNQGFTRMLSHIFSVHGCRRVDLITGIRGHYGSECMNFAYQEVLRAHGIPFDDRRVEYGDYWSKPAMAATERLLAYDIPEAIVCVNDDMAMACCAVLHQRGLNVPEDVIVTGCDGILRERTHTPRLTTCAKDYPALAASFFDVAELLMDGGSADAEYEIPPELRISESCGCRVTEKVNQNEAIEFYYNRLQASVILESYVHHFLGMLMEREQCTVIDYLDVLAEQMPSQSYICLRDCLSADISPAALKHFADGSELMSTVTLKRREKRFALIPRSELVPSLEDIFSRQTAMVITSIYWQDEIYGYYAYYGNDVDEECFKLPKFMHSAGSVIAANLNASRLRAMNEELRSARIRDALTGMLNMNGAVKALTERAAAEHTADRQLVLLVIGLTNLRQINAVFGHAEGDQALLSVAGAINDCVDSNVLTARVGGDEFLISLFVSDLHANTTANTADALVSVLTSRIRSYNQVSGKHYSLEIAVGKVSAPLATAPAVESLITEAIARKEEVKHSAMQQNGIVKAAVNSELAEAVAEILAENRLTYHFQPIVHAKTGDIFAYEALMRTNGERNISPLVLLQYAASLGKLYEVEWLTYRNVLTYIRENVALFRDHKVFLNSIPGHFLTDPDFETLRAEFSDLLPLLVVEFTEGAETVGDELHHIQDRCQRSNMEIAVDDYGTGYSNITNLLHYSPNYVKIDHSLISNIHEEPKKQHFVTNIIEFAHANGFLALAEGVETPEEMRAVIRFGVDLIQGNYTATPQPVPAAEIDPMIRIDMLKISTSVSGHSIRKTYMATGSEPIDIAKLAMEKYTDVFISQPHAELVGSFGIASSITIKCKDQLTSHIVVHDLHLSSMTNAPLIVLGRGSNITLECRGDNRLDHAGICVPETASLHLTGRGNLTISCSDVQSCAIGGDVEMGFGNINIDMAGCLQITTGGNRAIGIGGGYARGQTIQICGTKLFMMMDGAESIGIGAEEGNCEIALSGCSACMEIRSVSGVAIGVKEGCPDVKLNTVELEVSGSGKALAAVGSLTGGANIKLKDSTLNAAIKAKAVTVLGSDDNAPHITVKRSDVCLDCEGSRVLTAGSMTADAEITVMDTNFNVKLQATTALHLAAAEGKLLHIGGTEQLDINQ